MSGIVSGGPRTLLRLEALIVAIVALVAYAQQGAGWGLFATLFLAPDLSMLGYLAGRRAGAALYNAGHCYGLPVACIASGLLGQAPDLSAVGLIWVAHIGFDRALGYGLKYANGFGVGHLGLIGKAARVADGLTEMVTPAGRR